MKSWQMCGQAPAEIKDKDLTKEAPGWRPIRGPRVVSSTESVFTLLFATARQLAADQKLLGARPRWLNAGGISGRIARNHR